MEESVRRLVGVEKESVSYKTGVAWQSVEFLCYLTIALCSAL